MISRNGSRMRRFEQVLDLLPKDCVLTAGVDLRPLCR
jgi:hypothetical protein